MPPGPPVVRGTTPHKTPREVHVPPKEPVPLRRCDACAWGAVGPQQHWSGDGPFLSHKRSRVQATEAHETTAFPVVVCVVGSPATCCAPAEPGPLSDLCPVWVSTGLRLRKGDGGGRGVTRSHVPPASSDRCVQRPLRVGSVFFGAQMNRVLSSGAQELGCHPIARRMVPRRSLPTGGAPGDRGAESPPSTTAVSVWVPQPCSPLICHSGQWFSRLIVVDGSRPTAKLIGSPWRDHKYRSIFFVLFLGRPPLRSGVRWNSEVGMHAR